MPAREFETHRKAPNSRSFQRDRPQRPEAMPSPTRSAQRAAPTRRAQTERIALAKLVENPRNTHTHPNRQIRRIADSVRRFGFTSPIITDDKYVILAGHGRWKAAKLLGLQFVPVVVLHDLSDAERRAYMLADNKLAEDSGFDRSALAIELSELAPLLADAGLDIEITGFQPAEIDA